MMAPSKSYESISSLPLMGEIGRAIGEQNVFGQKESVEPDSEHLEADEPKPFLAVTIGPGAPELTPLGK